MREGGLEFLERQSVLWENMEKAIEAAKHQGVPVPPKPDHLPSCSPSKPEAGVVNPKQKSL